MSGGTLGAVKAGVDRMTQGLKEVVDTTATNSRVSGKGLETGRRLKGLVERGALDHPQTKGLAEAAIEKETKAVQDMHKAHDPDIGGVHKRLRLHTAERSTKQSTKAVDRAESAEEVRYIEEAYKRTKKKVEKEAAEKQGGR